MRPRRPQRKNNAMHSFFHIKNIGLSALMGLVFFWPSAPALAADGDESGRMGGKAPGSVQEAAPARTELKFDVEVSTGSGSAANAPEAAPLFAIDAEAAKVPAAPAEKNASPPPPGAPEAAPAGGSPLFEALDAWHREALANYSYNIASLYDPFMPMKEVRGRQDAPDALSPEEEAKLPPILKLELSQLKLVAITTVSGREGAALASFEDGAGSSYILRANDRIGRRGGRIQKIEAARVIVEEPPRGGRREPEITVMNLDVLDNSGLTYVE